MSDKAITGSYVDKRLTSGSGWECGLKKLGIIIPVWKNYSVY